MTTTSTAADRVPAVAGPDADVAGSGGAGRVRIEGIEHVYDDGDHEVVALAAINLAIEPGGFVSLVGPSGSGKTTLLNIVAGLITPTAGTIAIADPVGRRRRSAPIGYMTQHDTLLAWRRTVDNVQLPLEIEHVPRAERTERAVQLLESVGLGQFTKHYPHQLSGGMRQRASLARALVANPGVLLLDEPFGALDSGTRSALHAVLLKIHAELGTTVLLVTHDLGEAVALSDRVIALGARPGRIKREFAVPQRPSPETVRDLYSSPELIELHNEIRASIQAG
jgi:NitT/TauT family transport system ATP-binding protein